MKQTRILIVDDEPSILRFVGKGLRLEGYEVSEAQDGEEACRFVEECSPDLMILDIMMPKMNGFEVCRQVRMWSLVPIIMLSSKDSVMDKARSLNLGADAYMSKPFGIDELLARIKAVLRLSGVDQIRTGE